MDPTIARVLFSFLFGVLFKYYTRFFFCIELITFTKNELRYLSTVYTIFAPIHVYVDIYIYIYFSSFMYVLSRIDHLLRYQRLVLFVKAYLIDLSSRYLTSLFLSFLGTVSDFFVIAPKIILRFSNSYLISACSTVSRISHVSHR